MATYENTYPRPDFQRTDLKWKSLNNGWTLLFDDEDVGLQEGWHITGTPNQAVASSAPTSTTSPSSETTAEEAKRLAAFPELQARAFQNTSTSVQHNTKKPIQLPFAFQTPASGWGADQEAHEVLWYEARGVADPRTEADRAAGHRVLLRFGAVDYDAALWADGARVGGHRGGHVPWEADLTDALDKARDSGEGDGTTRLTLRVRDSPSDLQQPRGKQYWAPVPESIFYKPTSGVWQSVWLEVVPPARVGTSSDGTVLRATDIDAGVLRASVAVLGRRAGRAYAVEVEGSIGGVFVGTSARAALPADKDGVDVALSLKLAPEQLKALSGELTAEAPLDDPACWRDGLALWSHEHPLLYELKLRLYEGPGDAGGRLVDEVATQAGMRRLEWANGDGTFRLNGLPVFQALSLDQGYWPSTGLTPPDPDALRRDIALAKTMGLNGCRKHQKVEDPLFYYWADRLGFLVWAEMANAYEFGDAYVERFDQEWREAVRRDINHPSVVVWTPVNESWAYPDLKGSADQRNHIRSLYYATKTLDPTRPVNDNCGWEHILDDLSTFHDYNDAPYLSAMCASLDTILAAKKVHDRDFFVAPAGHRPGAPVICSEFGGVNIAPKSEAERATERDWGYTTATDPQDLLRRVENIVMAVVGTGIVSGFVWTQLTDIEQEVNGLFSFDRREKIPAAEVKKIFDRAAKIYLDGAGAKK